MEENTNSIQGCTMVFEPLSRIKDIKFLYKLGSFNSKVDIISFCSNIEDIKYKQVILNFLRDCFDEEKYEAQMNCNNCIFIDDSPILLVHSNNNEVMNNLVNIIKLDSKFFSYDKSLDAKPLNKPSDDDCMII